jgi:hypothetical protein
LCSLKIFIQHRFSSPVPLINRHRSLTEAVLYILRFDNQIPKYIEAPESIHLATTNNMLHCLGLLSAESAGRIPFEQTHGA